VIIKSFPLSPGLPDHHHSYLNNIDSMYVTDAYHSLSIERYRVSPELIEKVTEGDWNGDGNEADRQQKDAVAARGYFQTFLMVKESVKIF